MPNDDRHGFGPKLPDIEGGKEAIREVVSNLQSLFNADGIKIGKRVTVEGPRALNLDINVSDATPPKLEISLNDPRPRVNLAGWIKGDITGVVVSEEKIVIEIDSFPDVTLKVVS